MTLIRQPLHMCECRVTESCRMRLVGPAPGPITWLFSIQPSGPHHIWYKMEEDPCNPVWSLDQPGVPHVGKFFIFFLRGRWDVLIWPFSRYVAPLVGPNRETLFEPNWGSSSVQDTIKGVKDKAGRQLLLLFLSITKIHIKKAKGIKEEATEKLEKV